MKLHFPLKLLALLGTSMALMMPTATADPDKDQKEKHPSDHMEKKAGDKAHNKADKADKKADKADQQFEKKVAKAEQRDEKQAERRVYKKGEFRERFQDSDRDRIATYFSGFRDREHGLPPDLARKWKTGHRLPTGWRDRVVTGYVIEDDWYPAFAPVPYDWFPQLVVVPDTRLYWYGDRVVRVYEPTREVVDVIIIPTIHIDL